MSSICALIGQNAQFTKVCKFQLVIGVGITITLAPFMSHFYVCNVHEYFILKPF